MSAAPLRQILCPVALHPDGPPIRLPAIMQPDGAAHLIQADAPTDKAREQAAADTLYQHSGLESRAALFLGHDQSSVDPTGLYHFYLCRIVPPVRTRWQHLGPDGTLNRLSWIALKDDITFADHRDAALFQHLKAIL